MNQSFYMKEALKEAYKAYLKEEIPVGAVIVKDNKIIARAHNLREILKDATAHAEILAIREASSVLGGWRLVGCSLYVTMEPCIMCLGAIIQSRVEKLVIGARDTKSLDCKYKLELKKEYLNNNNIDITFGVLEDKSSRILKRFFKKLRKR
ncbi:nucleoside deaminase [Tepidibacter formicigenes]|uniref:tRNA-specific adenosine deaminase n=1 Tax=Tepidibacter formicigenes DSM 15518 TaxID=1123349 RepID=A0A1M6QAQ8_9FIRM|nr:nucleoside deaminase [Tepidibacter formicigenes]SHK17220.1 tRNA(adenine34) deaminase [Tepidibacter formicigenes DSM 15518]